MTTWIVTKLDANGKYLPPVEIEADDPPVDEYTVSCIEKGAEQMKDFEDWYMKDGSPVFGLKQNLEAAFLAGRQSGEATGFARGIEAAAEVAYDWREQAMGDIILKLKEKV